MAGSTPIVDPAAGAHIRGRRQQALPTILLALLLVSLVGTGVSIASFFVPGAVVSALFVTLFYGLLVAVRLRDRWARARLDAADPVGADHRRRAEDPERDVEEIAPDVTREIVAAERAGFRMGLIILAPLAALALVLAAVFVGWKVIGLGTLAFLAMMIFMGLPVWLAATEDEIEDGQERMGVEVRSIR